MKDTESVKKIEMFGYSIGYRWAEMCRCWDLRSLHSKKIQNPAWNSLEEVIKDIRSQFWVDVFGVECTSMHTDNTVHCNCDG